MLLPKESTSDRTLLRAPLGTPQISSMALTIAKEFRLRGKERPERQYAREDEEMTKPRFFNSLTTSATVSPDNVRTLLNSCAKGYGFTVSRHPPLPVTLSLNNQV